MKKYDALTGLIGVVFLIGVVVIIRWVDGLIHAGLARW